METKSNQKYCQWLSGEIVEKKSLRLTQVRIPAKTFFNKDFFGQLDGLTFIDKRFNDLFKRAIDIGYQLMEKLNQENCQWLIGVIIQKPLRLEFESMQMFFSIEIFQTNCVEKGGKF